MVLINLRTTDGNDREINADRDMTICQIENHLGDRHEDLVWFVAW